MAIFDLDVDKAQRAPPTSTGLGRARPRHPVRRRLFRSGRPGVPEADRQLGGLDILVNNAGADPPVAHRRYAGGGLGLHPPQQPQERVPLLEGGRPADDRPGRGGRIIAISSIHAVLSEPNCGHYTAAKGGIEAFCRTLATEMAPHKITVNFIRPGATFTELTEPMYTAVGEAGVVRARVAEGDRPGRVDRRRGGVPGQRRARAT